MRFGSIDLEQSWQERLERELMVTQTDFEVHPISSAPPANSTRIQFGQWSDSRRITFERDGSD